MQLACERSEAKLEKIRLYERGAAFDPAHAVAALKTALTPATRVVALTWVHSSTGVRLPLRQLADVIDAANHGRSAENYTLDIAALALTVITASSLRLDDQLDRERLWRAVERTAPRLLLLDPLVRMHANNRA